MRNAAFWGYGWRMARRAMSRSALAVVSLAVATLVAAFSLTIDTGRPGAAAIGARRYLGGDLIVQVPALDLPGVALPPGATWTWQPPAPAQGDPLAWFFPSLLWSGAPEVAAAPGEVARVAATLAGFPGVASAEPLRALPALWSYAPGKYARVAVLARDPAVDAATGFAKSSLTAGRYFLPSEASQAVALVDGFRPAEAAPYARYNGQLVAFSLGRPETLAAPAPAPGSALALQVPAWRGGAPDWSQLSPVSLRVVGQYAVPDGHWNWQAQRLTPAGLAEVPAADARSDQDIEPADWATGAVLVPQAYWSALAAQVGWQPPAGQGAWVLRLTQGLADANQVEAALQRALPGASVVGVAALDGSTASARDPAVAVPVTDAAGSERGATPSPPPPAAPPWVGQLTSAAGYLVAVLLFAGNLYVVVVNRRREVAGLRAAGASVGEIAALLGAEIATVAGLGAACGLVVALPFLSFQVLSNGLGLGGMLLAWGHLLAVVLGGTVPLAAVTLALATLWAARLPVLAVLRGG